MDAPGTVRVHGAFHVGNYFSNPILPIAKMAEKWRPGRLLILFLLCLPACQNQPSAYELAVLRHRFEKDAALAEPEASVLLETDRVAFRGLSYFPVDSTYRFLLPLIPADTVEIVDIAQQTGGTKPYLRQGTVALPFETDTCTLAVFLPMSGPKRSWIPFTDQTSGEETYGGGRYLDVNIENGIVEVDFNYAYNPFCAYNPEFVCGLPPAENHLPVAIEAGEKASPFSPGHAAGRGSSDSLSKAD